MMKLLLYGTSACHLCEIAEQLITPVLQEQGIRLQKIDISDDDCLLERYGIRIPVLRWEGLEEELGWPFSEQAFLEYLNLPPGGQNKIL